MAAACNPARADATASGQRPAQRGDDAVLVGLGEVGAHRQAQHAGGEAPADRTGVGVGVGGVAGWWCNGRG